MSDTNDANQAPFDWSEAPTPVVAMLHLRPLPGSPGFGGDLGAVLRAVLEDAETLAEAGVHALLMENFGDRPYFPRRVPPETIASMTALAAEVRRRVPLPLGINVLRNDGRAALAIAAAVEAPFIRVNVLCGVRVTDQGIIEGIAHHLARDRARLAPRIQILADVDVKHSAPLALRPLEDEIHDLIERGGADAVVVSGSRTGQAVDPALVRQARAAAGATPIVIGSGMTPETLDAMLPLAAGFIVGSYFKREGRPTASLDPKRIRAFMDRLVSSL